MQSGKLVVQGFEYKTAPSNPSSVLTNLLRLGRTIWVFRQDIYLEDAILSATSSKSNSSKIIWTLFLIVLAFSPVDLIRGATAL